MKIFLLALIVFLLPGCETIHMHEVEVPDTELAELSISNFIGVRDFDGKPKGQTLSGSDYRWKATTFKISPGHHHIVAYYLGIGGSPSRMSDDVTVEFDALPGRKYVLKFETRQVPPRAAMSGNRETTVECRMWVEEVK